MKGLVQPANPYQFHPVILNQFQHYNTKNTQIYQFELLGNNKKQQRQQQHQQDRLTI
jgi:hypothetical protein